MLYLLVDKANKSALNFPNHIVERCKKNDRKAQQILYAHFAPRMYGVCLRYYPNADVAHDILQDGFIKVFQKVKTYKGTGSFESWIRRIMINTALEYHRKRKETVQIDGEKEHYNLSSVNFIDNDYQLLLSFVSALPQQYRLVFNLYALDGYSHKEIAEKLKISVSTSKSNYSRARSILKEKVRLIDKYEDQAILRTRSS